jgi:hypothetical protein
MTLSASTSVLVVISIQDFAALEVFAAADHKVNMISLLRYSIFVAQYIYIYIYIYV